MLFQQYTDQNGQSINVYTVEMVGYQWCPYSLMDEIEDYFGIEVEDIEQDGLEATIYVRTERVTTKFEERAQLYLFRFCND